MNSCVWPVGSSRTVCASQTLSSRLRVSRGRGRRMGLGLADGASATRRWSCSTPRTCRAGDGPFPTIFAAARLGRERARSDRARADAARRSRARAVSAGAGRASRSGRASSASAGSDLSAGRPPDRVGHRARRRWCAASSTTRSRRYPVDRRKLVRRWASPRAACMAYDLVLRDPGASPGLVALSSWLPTEIAESIPAQPGLANLPAFVAHGTRDPMIPIARAQASREVLIKRGLGLDLPRVRDGARDRARSAARPRRVDGLEGLPPDPDRVARGGRC